MQLALLVAALTSALGAAAPTGKYEGSVPFIIDITADFKSATACDFEINVKVAHQDIKCPGESVTMSDTGVTFPNIANTGDCMGDNLRGQKKDVSKYSLDINSDGTLTFHSDGYPNMKLTKKSTLLVQDTCSLYAINGDTCGQSDLDCKYTKYAKAAEKSLQDGTCSSQGYTVKGKVTTKSYPVIGDITITDYTKPAVILI